MMRAVRLPSAAVGGVWLAAMVTAAGLGWLVGSLAGVRDLAGSPSYQLAAAALLAIGLYGSTYGIGRAAAWSHAGAILFAVTAGVVIKAALLVAFVYVFVDPRLAVVGLAVAQIDPLAVSAMLGRSGMSTEAQVILRSWAAFDDPVTALLTVYAVALLIAPDADPGSAGFLAYAGGLPANLALVAAGLVVWLLLRPRERRGDSGQAAGARQALLLVGLAAMLAFATANFLMLGVAVLGLFFRPRLDRVMGPLLTVALLTATFAVGLLMVNGVALLAGAGLGVAAFLAQAVTAVILPARGLTRKDRIYLALGQQNGITAVILALALEPSLPGAVALVAPAVLVVNALHLATNAWWDLPGRSAPPLAAAGGQPPPSS